MYNFSMQTKPNPAQIISWRGKRRQKHRQGPDGCVNRLGAGILTFFTMMLAVAVIIGGFYYATFTQHLPSIAGLPSLLGPGGSLRYPTQLFDRSGEYLLYSIENPNTLTAEYLYLEAIPEFAVQATLAVRDPDFWEHEGFLWNAEKPTITEQLVLELLLAQEEEGLHKTWRTRLLAVQITKTFGRETILEWYLNNANYGQLAFGIDEAAWVYFGKSAREINLAEAALLAAAVDAPALNPIDTPQLAIERQGKILNTMLADDLISEDQAFNANEDPILVQTTALPTQMQAPDFVEAALDSLAAALGEERIQRGGYQITTSLDLNLQNQATCTLQVQLSRLEGSLPTDTLGGIDCAGASLLPRMNTGEVLNVPGNQGGIVVIDTASGEVLALVGEANAPQPAGTILTPFIYLTSFTRGLNPASLVWDIPASVPPSLEEFGNLDWEYHGPVRIRTALTQDYLVSALSVLQQVGPSNAWRTTQQSGIYSLEIPTAESSFSPLGDQGKISLLEVTHAYSMFANRGTLSGHTLTDEDQTMPPITVLTVTDYSGRTLIDNSVPQIRPVTTAQLAYLITDILSDEAARRESLGHPNPLEIGRTAAAKLGQTLSGTSTWTVGYTPQRVVGVWLGIPENDGANTQLSPLISAGVWHAVTKTASQSLPIQSFSEPVGIQHITVCEPSGLLPTEHCPTTVTETFITGSEPVQTDNLYRTFTINSQTGRLATIYTPAEFIEEKVYLVVPPEAAEWARQQGLEVPPDTYDVIFNPGPASETASITSPEIFGYVSGEVEIKGNAGGPDFNFYRVQVGAGLNPRQWLQVGDGNRVVNNRTLAEWDTSGLNGLYAIQLQVVDDNQVVQTAVIQVTIDNQPPAVQVLHPTEGQVFLYPDERMITFQAQVTDNLGIEKVEFYVDDQLISNRSDPPYAAPWTGTTGEHELVIRATDQAGNQTETSVIFLIER
jgi:membrane peptidoglycan carboxypeptidase